jgi:branched-chain amino acid transport system substrate-binding protein
MSTDLNGGPTMGEHPDPPTGTEPDADVRTFLIADVRGYTAFTQAYGDEKAGALAARFAALVREAVTAAGGEVVELRGDEALCVFRSARQALRAAVELQTRFRERVNGQPAFPLGIGIGLDSGEAVPIEGGYRGGALNLAARLCSIAAPGQILATETVTSLSRAQEGVRFTDRRRPVRMKGLEKPVRVIEVVPEAELPPVPEAPMARARRRRRGLLMVGAGAVILAAVAVVAVLQFTANGDGEPEVLADSGIGQLDPATGDVLGAVPLGPAPSTVAVGEGAAWVIDANDQTISRIDANEPGDPQVFSTGSTPSDLAVGQGAVWVANLGDDLFPRSISRLDPDSRAVVETIDLPRSSGGFIPFFSGFSRQHVAVSPGAVWAINPDLTISRIDPRTNRLVSRVRGIAAVNIAAGDGGLWVVDGEEGIAEIDPRTNAVARRIKVDAESLATLTVGAGSVWVTDPFGGTVTRIEPDPDPNEVVQRTIPLDTWVGGIDFGDGAVWATNEIADKVYRIDPSTNRFRVVRGMTAPRGIAVGEGAAWVTTAGPPSADAALPASACSSILYGGEGKPTFLLVSDLPLRGDAGPTTRAMVDGIRFALERRGFEAGKFSVGYQSCDSSTAQSGGIDEYRCVLNAKAYARNLDVMAVIGAWNSPCSYFQLPFANQAPQGPLAMISPSNTFTGLTRSYRDWPPSELETMYPSGERNYVRIAAANHLLAVAMIELAQELGAKSVFLLGEEDGMHADARRAARNLGLDVSGAAGWDPEARDFTALARRIARTRPEAVTIFGVFGPNEGALIRDLRDALGPDVPLIAIDGFMPLEGLVKLVGPAARGMYLGVYGLPNHELPPTGERFLEEFEAAQGGGATPSYAATYGAQAVEIVLDAMARSDGTRASVTRELRRTTVEDGILGDIRFDENGDLVEGPLTFFRAVGTQRPSAILAGVRGYAFDRVITARAALLR